jgi:hypothetical protein
MFPAAMTENWKPYLCNVNDRLASIFVNLGLRGKASNSIKAVAALDLGLFSIAASRWSVEWQGSSNPLQNRGRPILASILGLLLLVRRKKGH